MKVIKFLYYINGFCDIVILILLQPNLITIQLGICSPKQCTNKDLTILWNEVFGKILPGGANCQNVDYTMDGGRIAAL